MPRLSALLVSTCIAVSEAVSFCLIRADLTFATGFAPDIYFKLSSSAAPGESCRTPVKYDNDEGYLEYYPPFCCELSDAPASAAPAHLTIEMWDKDLASDDLIGSSFLLAMPPWGSQYDLAVDGGSGGALGGSTLTVSATAGAAAGALVAEKASAATPGAGSGRPA